MASRHELIGVYQGLRHPSCCWSNDDGSQTIIGTIEVADVADSGGVTPWGASIEVPSSDEATIKGTINPNALVRNITYRFFGYWKSHPKYGDQFIFESFVVEEPAGEAAVVAYLTQCKGIGPVMARAMFREYRDDAVKTLREQPEEVASKIPRLSLETAREASAFLTKSAGIERTKMDLFSLLKGRYFPKNVIDKVLNDFGAEAAQVIARNPYLLMRYKGCGFLKTDKMYIDMGLNPLRMKRQALCAWNSVARQSGGDTWFPFYVVQRGLRDQISSARIDVERAMRLAVRHGMLVEKFHRGQRWVAEAIKANHESTIAERLDEAAKEQSDGVAPVLWLDVSDGLTDVTDHQREQARLATSGFVTILAGRPGTGKTFTTARIVRSLAEEYGEHSIAVAAPTGKAAVRVTAAMNAVGSNLVARTVHSLLGMSAHGFEHNRWNPLKKRFIIIDESSMLDAYLAVSLLDARAEGAHILFVGDPNQLAPVGHGAPLRDMITANVPHGELREIQRNSGRIVKACSDIIDVAKFIPSEKLDVPNGENLALVERDSADSQIDTLTSLMNRFRSDFEAGKEGAVDPVWGVQIIVPVNKKKSELGRKTLNPKLQELLNADGLRVANNPFRVGDKIINTKNGEYKSVVEPDENADADEAPLSAYVANGEQAEVLEVDESKIIARLTSPDRVILIPRSKPRQSEDGQVPETEDDGDNEESTGSGCAWELAYAISGHKSQGSEWPVVIVLVDDYGGAKMVQSKQWIYTAISRAKRVCFVIGQSNTVAQACRRDALFDRKTFLVELITELRNRMPRIEFTEEVLADLLAGV